MDEKISIVIPTLKERDNLAILIPELNQNLRNEKLDFEIIIVDDNSQDGSKELIEAFNNNEIPITLIERKTTPDLTSSVLEGFKHTKGTIIVLMDGDMSHPPKIIPELVRPIISKKYDISIGSRYIEGGSCLDWSWIRHLMSRGAGLLARGLTNIKDPTSGLIAFRKDCIDLESISPVGWKVALEIAVKARLPIIKVPINFSEREFGKSKLNFKVFKQYLYHLIQLYRWKFRH